MMPAGHVALQDLFRMLCLMAGTDQLLLLRINWSRMGKSLNTLFCKSGLKNKWPGLSWFLGGEGEGAKFSSIFHLSSPLHLNCLLVAYSFVSL